MKIFNIVIGLAVVIVFSALFTLGLKAFYPAPEYPQYPFSSQPNIAPASPPYCDYTTDKVKCDSALKSWETQTGMTKAEYDAAMADYNKKTNEYNEAVKKRNGNIFIIANIIGILIFAAGFIVATLKIKTAIGIGIGIILSGIYAIIYGYATSWNSTNDKIKFFVGFAIAALIVLGGIWFGKKHEDA